MMNCAMPSMWARTKRSRQPVERGRDLVQSTCGGSRYASAAGRGTGQVTAMLTAIHQDNTRQYGTRKRCRVEEIAAFIVLLCPILSRQERRARASKPSIWVRFPVG